MELYQRQQFDFLLMTAADRFVERIVKRNEGVENAIARLQQNPQGDGIWLDEFVAAIFQDFLLDNSAGATFILQALEKQSTLPPSAGTIEQMLKSMAQRAFADLLQKKVLEALEQASMYG